jgi:hypothetical protein
MRASRHHDGRQTFQSRACDGGMRFVCHSGHQNNFATHFYLNPELRAAYIVAFNTFAPPKQSNPAHDTDGLDRQLKEHLFEHVFPLFKKIR